MSTEISICPARFSDAAAISKLMEALGYPSNADQVERRLAFHEACEDSVVLVAEHIMQPVGVLSFHRIPLFHDDGYLGRITSLVISPDHQRRGIGRLLVAAVEEHAWKHDCSRMEVTSGDHRADAHAFYERLGYGVDCRRFIKRRPV